MKRIRLFEWDGERSFFYQWGRFKRRERNLYLFVYVAWLLHIVFWILWIIFIAPYPIALTVPLGFSLGVLGFLKDFLWPLFILILLILNSWLVFFIYPKDILASWLLLGATVFIQIIVLGIAVSLMAISV